jgi:hypothetical protein
VTFVNFPHELTSEWNFKAGSFQNKHINFPPLQINFSHWLTLCNSLSLLVNFWVGLQSREFSKQENQLPGTLDQLYPTDAISCQHSIYVYGEWVQLLDILKNWCDTIIMSHHVMWWMACCFEQGYSECLPIAYMLAMAPNLVGHCIEYGYSWWSSYASVGSPRFQDKPSHKNLPS